MADATISELGHERLLIGTLALAYTGYDVLTNKVELWYNSKKSHFYFPPSIFTSTLISFKIFGN